MDKDLPRSPDAQLPLKGSAGGLPEQWRYVPVVGKAPIERDWTNKPYQLEDITTPGYGLMLGPVSGGVVAIDFDGPEAMDFFDETILPTKGLPYTVIWSSGKKGRCQMAFWVEERYWPHLRSRKVGPGNKLEFRWAGGQSVLPPSPHPETGHYEWVLSPDDTEVAMLPPLVLQWWLNDCLPPAAPSAPPFQPTNMKAEEAYQVIEVLKSYYPTLDYARWASVTWALVREVGEADALAIMRRHYPEQKQGEYRQLVRGFQVARAKPVTMGTIIHMIRVFNLEFRIKSIKATETARKLSARTASRMINQARKTGRTT